MTTAFCPPGQHQYPLRLQGPRHQGRARRERAARPRIRLVRAGIAHRAATAAPHSASTRAISARRPHIRHPRAGPDTPERSFPHGNPPAATVPYSARYPRSGPGGIWARPVPTKVPGAPRRHQKPGHRPRRGVRPRHGPGGSPNTETPNHAPAAVARRVVKPPVQTHFHGSLAQSFVF